MKSKADRLKIKETDNEVEAEDRGVVYVGHLPHGFIEDGLKEYFS